MPLLVIEGCQVVARYLSVIRSQDRINHGSRTYSHHVKCDHNYVRQPRYMDSETDDDLMENIPSVPSSRASSVRGAPSERGRVTTQGGRKSQCHPPYQRPPPTTKEKTDKEESTHQDTSASHPCHRERHPPIVNPVLHNCNCNCKIFI